VCSDVQCSEFEVCVVQGSIGICSCKQCGATTPLQPLCGTDCEVYFSQCHLNFANCETGSQVTVLNYGNTCNSESPLILSAPDTQFLEEGQPLKLSVAVSGIPVPTVTWYNGDEVMGEGTSFYRDHALESHSGTWHVEAKSCSLIASSQFEVIVDPLPQPLSVCQMFGDPNIVTFDGFKYSMSGLCSYIIALDCDYVTWMVYVTIGSCGDRATCVQSVLIYNNHVPIMLGRGWHVSYRNDEITVREYKRYHLGNGAHILLKGTTLEVTLGRAGVKVLWDGWNTVTVATTKPGISTCGLCGNNNGRNDDELINSWFVGPHMIRDTSVFANSWAVDHYRTCTTYPTIWNENQPCVDDSVNRCKAVFSSLILQRECSQYDLYYYLAACEKDACHSEQLRHNIECQVASSFATYCTLKGGSPWGWEKEAGCPELCEVTEAVFSTGCPLSHRPWPKCNN